MSHYVPLDEATKKKIVGLYRDHGIAVRDIAERYGRGIATIKGVLVEAGLLSAGSASKARPATASAFDVVLAAAIAGHRCPMNDCLPGGSKSLSIMARQGKIFVEVFVHNFRRVTILTGDHKGKTTANPPKYAGKVPKPYLTIGLAKRRNGAVIPSVLDGRQP